MELSGTVFLLITCNVFVTEFVYIINISVKTRSDSKLKHMQCCVNSAYYGFPLFYVCSADLLGWLVFHLCRLIFLIPRMTILNSASEGSSLRQCQKGFSTAKLALPIAYSGIKHIWGVLRIRHSLLLRSSLTYSLSPFLWLCESTSKLITKATRCLDVPDTSRRHCVPSLSETDGDRHWMILKTYPRCGTQWALLRHAFSRATWWSMTLMFLHYDFFLTPPRYLSRTPPPPLHCIHSPQNLPEQSYTRLWSELSLTLVVLKKNTALTMGQNVSHSHCLPSSLFHYLSSFIHLSTCSTEQCSAGGQGGGSWQDW